MIKKCAWFVLAGICLACQNEQHLKKSYVDMDSLVTAQVAALASSGSSLQKEAAINGKSAGTTSQPDSLGWARELEVFRQLDLINRPVYRDAYEVRCGEKDTRSNLSICSMTGKGNLPVTRLNFYYLDERSHLKKITATHQESNGLYFMNRRLEMNFDDINGKLMLTGYAIDGTQKMTLRDSVHYSVRSRIHFRN